MSGKRLTLIAVLLCFFDFSPPTAAQTPRFDFEAGQSIYVIAVKTSGRAERAIWDRFFPDLTQLACGEVVRFQFVGQPSVSRLQLAPTLERSAMGQTPLISTDPILQSEIQKAVKKQKKFKLAETLDAADFVLIAFAKYPFAQLTMQGKQVISAWRSYEDSPYSPASVLVLAFVLSEDAYSQTGTGVRELSDVALWQGYTQVDNHRCTRTAQADAANELMKRFHKQVRKENRKNQPNPAAPSRLDRGRERPPQLKVGDDTHTPPSRTFASSPGAAVRVATTAVIVPVAVSDRDGRHISNLTQTDFRLFENDVEQKIDHFRTVEAPFRVALLLDSSASMLLKNEDLSRAASSFVDRLQPQDQVMVVSFDSEISPRVDFTSNREILREAIAGIRPGAGTRLYDAVDLILTERLSQVEGRKAIVLFTDGVDTESWLADARRTVGLAEESGTLIYSISYDTAEDVPERPMQGQVNGRSVEIRTDRPNAANVGLEAYQLGEKYVSELTRATGALEYKATSVDDLDRAFAQIAGELRRQYELAYYPTSSVEARAYRRITVKVNRPEGVVRARPGYRSPRQQ